MKDSLICLLLLVSVILIPTSATAAFTSPDIEIQHHYGGRHGGCGGCGGCGW